MITNFTRLATWRVLGFMWIIFETTPYFRGV